MQIKTFDQRLLSWLLVLGLLMQGYIGAVHGPMVQIAAAGEADLLRPVICTPFGLKPIDADQSQEPGRRGGDGAPLCPLCHSVSAMSPASIAVGADVTPPEFVSHPCPAPVAVAIVVAPRQRGPSPRAPPVRLHSIA